MRARPDADSAVRRMTDEPGRDVDGAPAVQGIPGLIWVSAADAHCTWVNRQLVDFTGRPFHAHLGDGWIIDLHPDDVRMYLAGLHDAFAAGGGFEPRVRLRPTAVTAGCSSGPR